MDWLLAYPMWPKYLGLAVALAAISSARYRACLLVISIALVAEQPLKHIGIDNVIWVSFASVWVAVAGAVRRQSVTTCGIIIYVSACYAWGRISGHPFEKSDPMWISPLFWADMGLVAAILFSGARGAWATVGDFRRRGMGWHTHRRGDPAGVHRAHLHEEAK